MRGRASIGKRWLAASAAVAVTAATTFGATAHDAADSNETYSTAVQLAGTTLGVGGTTEGWGLSIPFNFNGTIMPEGDLYWGVAYPGMFLVDIPVISDLPVLSDLPYWPQSMGSSVDKGVAALGKAVAKMPPDEKTTIIGMSQGAMVVENVRADMADDPNYVQNAQNYEFILLGNPYRPAGGIATRLTGFMDAPIFNLLDFSRERPASTDSPFKTTDYSNQYDPVSDFPAYFNPLALANAGVGFFFQHAIPGYFFDDPNAANRVETTVGNTTYVLLPQHLPLLYPMHVAASLVGMERFVDFMEPTLRVLVEMGYDRTADPSKVQPFSFFTPRSKIEAGLRQLPGAIAEGAEILAGKPYTPPAPPAPIVSGADPGAVVALGVDASEVAAQREATPREALRQVAARTVPGTTPVSTKDLSTEGTVASTPDAKPEAPARHAADKIRVRIEKAVDNKIGKNFKIGKGLNRADAERTAGADKPDRAGRVAKSRR